jgi:hypothetical protein
MANRFLNNITINDEYTLPAADGTADQIITTDGAGQLSFVDQSTINAGNAEHVVIYAKNTHTAQIAKGTPVYITGTVGATDTVEIAPADAGNASHMPAVGLVDDTLAINAFGYVITGGFMDNVTTDPIDGATPSSNDTVYVKVGGGLTLTKPTGPTGLIQNIAKVGKVSGGNSGSLIVSSILRTNDIPNLTTGRIWVGDGNTVESDTVFLDETNERMGIGTTSPSARLEVQGTNSNTQAALKVTDSGDSFFEVVPDNNTTFKIGDLDAVGDEAMIVGTFSDITFSKGGTTTMILDSNNRVGIGTTSPAKKLTIGGIGIGNTDGLKIEDPSNTAYGAHYSYDDASSTVEIGGVTNNVLNDCISIARDATRTITINTSENVGIGTTSPRTKLHVSGLTGDDDPSLGSSTAPLFVSNTANTYGLNIGVNNVGASWLQAQSNTSATAYEMSLNPLGGNVGVGFINPAYKLDVNGTGRFTDTLYYSSLVQQSQADTKKDIADIDKNKATAIPFKQYKYKTGDTERVRYGVVVEDIEQYYPELVHIGEDGIKGVSYIDLLVKRVAELEKELEEISLTPGATGPQGPKGPAGADGKNGSDGKNGADGNSHLSNVTSIAFNYKANTLQVNIGGTVYNFAPLK